MRKGSVSLTHGHMDYDDEFEFIPVDNEVWDDDDDDENDDDDDDEHPCVNCSSNDSCDAWDAGFCCILCHYYNEDPDCTSCDITDI